MFDGLSEGEIGELVESLLSITRIDRQFAMGVSCSETPRAERAP